MRWCFFEANSVFGHKQNTGTQWDFGFGAVFFFACLFVLVFSLSNSNSRSRRCDEGPVVGLAQ